VARYAGALPAIVIACGPMTSKQCPTVGNVVASIAAVNPSAKMRFLNLTLPDAQLEGCIGHPNVAGHAALLEQLEPVLREVTGW